MNLEKLRTGYASRQYARPVSGMTVAFALILAVSLMGRQPLRTNLQNLSLAHSLCWNIDCYSEGNPGLVLRLEPEDAWEQGKGLNVCQMVWLSRLRMSESPEAAEAALDVGIGCPRDELVTSWAGDLAWAQGHSHLATELWAQLPVDSLLGRGYQLMLDGDVERGRSLLEVVEERHGSELSVSQRWQLYTRLGHSYRIEANWPKAVDYYAQALNLTPSDTETRFFLGIGHLKNNHLDEAISVLTDGLDELPSARPGFVSTYLLQLGLAYKEAGQNELAVASLRSAQDWLQKESQPWPNQQRFIQEQLDWLVSQAGQE